MIEWELKTTKEDKKGKSMSDIYKISQAIKEKETLDAQAIKDPESKKLIVDKDVIKKVSLSQSNDPEETMKEVCATREEIAKQRLKENTNKVFEANNMGYI